MAEKSTRTRTRRKNTVSGDDIIRRLADMAFGRANDCVRLALDPEVDVDGLDLCLLAEIRRSDKGMVEVKLVDRLAVLEALSRLTNSQNTQAAALFQALESGCDRTDGEDG
jgi:hypothetical protein